MTEAEWLAGREPRPLLNSLYGKTSDRKFRLFACACCDMVECSEWGFELGAEIRKAVDVARQFADGQAPDRERIAALRAMTKRVREPEAFAFAARFAVEKKAWSAAAGACECVANDLSRMGYEHEREEILARANEALAEVVRESFGALHLRPIPFSTAWRTRDVTLLAQGIYDANAFDRMPILADALQDAGCDSDDILTHCRDPHTAHVRGYWVVDLVLGKK